jgi:hypothetical protein
MRRAERQICAMPPSTKSSTPLTKLLSSEARNTTALPIALPDLTALHFSDVAGSLGLIASSARLGRFWFDP